MRSKRKNRQEERADDTVLSRINRRLGNNAEADQRPPELGGDIPDAKTIKTLRRQLKSVVDTMGYDELLRLNRYLGAPKTRSEDVPGAAASALFGKATQHGAHNNHRKTGAPATTGVPLPTERFDPGRDGDVMHFIERTWAPLLVNGLVTIDVLKTTDKAAYSAIEWPTSTYIGEKRSGEVRDIVEYLEKRWRRFISLGLITMHELRTKWDRSAAVAISNYTSQTGKTIPEELVVPTVKVLNDRALLYLAHVGAGGFNYSARKHRLKTGRHQAPK